MTFRRFLLLVHRWLGLGSALVLIVAGVTGAILAFPDLGGRWAGRWHDSLALGRPGVLVVVAATGLAVILQATGLWLWWRTRRIRVSTKKGWRGLVSDLHHSIGAMGLIVMLVISLTALVRFGGHYLDPANRYGDLRQAISRLHTTAGYPIAAKALLAAGSLCFAVQGITGVFMWWRPRR
jgi:uncharacterized iron-regulated membrane protein